MTLLNGLLSVNFHSWFSKMLLKLKQNKCIALQEQENSPICRDCIQNQVEDWLRIRRPRLVPALRKKAYAFFNNANYTNYITCSMCNKKINTCDFCFRQHIIEWIKGKYPNLLAEFKLFFGF